MSSFRMKLLMVVGIFLVLAGFFEFLFVFKFHGLTFSIFLGVVFFVCGLVAVVGLVAHAEFIKLTERITVLEQALESLPSNKADPEWIRTRCL